MKIKDINEVKSIVDFHNQYHKSPKDHMERIGKDKFKQLGTKFFQNINKELNQIPYKFKEKNKIEEVYYGLKSSKKLLLVTFYYHPHTKELIKVGILTKQDNKIELRQYNWVQQGKVDYERLPNGTSKTLENIKKLNP